MIKKYIKKALEKTGYTLVRKNVRLDFVAWAQDNDFEKVYREVSNYSLLDRDRLFMLWQFAKQAAVLPGSFSQIGVFRGGSAKLICSAKKNFGNNNSYFLFDTFQGMPQVNDKIDIHKEGDFSDTTVEAVQKLLSDHTYVKFCPGFFPKTATVIKDEMFSFVYIDVDIYQSILDSLNFFYPRTNKGGFILIDDYMGKNTPGVKKAMDEFLTGKSEKPIITTVGQCVLIKQ